MKKNAAESILLVQKHLTQDVRDEGVKHLCYCLISMKPVPAEKSMGWLGSSYILQQTINEELHSMFHYRKKLFIVLMLASCFAAWGSLAEAAPGTAHCVSDPAVPDSSDLQTLLNANCRDITLSRGVFTGPFVIPVTSQSVRIRGSSIRKTVLSGGTNSRVLTSYPLYGSVSLERMTIGRGNTSDDGGCLSTKGESLDINFVIFSDCHSGRDGGALYTTANDISIRATHFTQNSASQRGGAAFLQAITPNTSAVIYNTTFSENEAISSGGALGIGEMDEVTVEYHSVFRGNRSGYKGGAINVSGNARTSLTLDKAEFTGNVGKRNGGAVNIEDGGRINVLESQFDNNEVETFPTTFFTYAGHGGAISASDVVSMQISDSGFLGNRAGLDLQDPTTENSSGGAVYLIRPNGVNIDGSVFTQNSSVDAGAVAIVGQPSFAGFKGDLVVGATLFQENHALMNGGAVRLDLAQNVRFTATTFIENQADVDGGAVYSYLDEGAPNLTNVTFSGNVATGNGGGLFLTHNQNGGFGGNWIHTGFAFNSANEGSGVYFDRTFSPQVSVYGGYFIQNAAGRNCGGNPQILGSTLDGVTPPNGEIGLVLEDRGTCNITTGLMPGATVRKTANLLGAATNCRSGNTHLLVHPIQTTNANVGLITDAVMPVSGFTADMDACGGHQRSEDLAGVDNSNLTIGDGFIDIGPIEGAF